MVNHSRRSFEAGELAYHLRILEGLAKLHGKAQLREYKRQLAWRSSVFRRWQAKKTVRDRFTTDMATNQRLTVNG